jgi:hypothetical protein
VRAQARAHSLTNSRGGIVNLTGGRLVRRNFLSSRFGTRHEYELHRQNQTRNLPNFVSNPIGLTMPRVIYAETFAHGKTALEIDPKGVAAQEVTALWTALKEKLENLNS